MEQLSDSATTKTAAGGGLDAPPHLRSRLIYPPGATALLYDGDYANCPPEVRRRCFEYVLHYLLAHGEIPTRVVRQLCLFAGFLLPLPTADAPTLPKLFGFLDIFDWEPVDANESKDERAKRARTARLQKLHTDMYGLQVGQKIMVDTFTKKSGTIALNRHGHAFYLDFIARNPRSPEPYKRPAPCQAFLEYPVRTAISDVEREAAIRAEEERCGRSCMARHCDLNKTHRDVTIGLGTVYASATDRNLFLSGVSADDFRRELEIDPSESHVGVYSLGARLGPFTQCVLMVCESCASTVNAQYRALATEGARKLADDSGLTRADLDPVALVMDPRHNEICESCHSYYRFVQDFVDNPTASTLSDLARRTATASSIVSPAVVLEALASDEAKRVARPAELAAFEQAARRLENGGDN
ncbi:hypothetical protein JCM3766R1_006483 [Sporobolomyces carnicolor]